MNNIFNKSEKYRDEYAASIVKVEQIKPIEGKDRICIAVVSGYEVIVGKEDLNVGDILIYFPIECIINPEYLSKNNLYSNSELNQNPDIKGYFNNLGRVRILKLGESHSMGFLAKPISFKCIAPTFPLELSEYLGERFDMIYDKEICHVFIPTEVVNHHGNSNRANKTLKRFDKIIPGSFVFHYDTKKFNDNIHLITPETSISITEKLHGTSFVIANIPIKVKLNIIQKVLKLFGKHYEETKYDVVYSSRHVILNRYINPKNSNNHPKPNEYNCIYDKLKYFIEEDTKIYGEIIGYKPGCDRAIQTVGKHKYTYGEMPGYCKLMIYRVNKNGKELNVNEVYNYTVSLIINYPTLKDYLLPIHIFYDGLAGKLYPVIAQDENWNVNFLELLKQEKAFYMEEDEPTCPKGTPSEGIVIRINDDPTTEAYKLKCLRFLDKEAIDMDKGIVDQETIESI